MEYLVVTAKEELQGYLHITNHHLASCNNLVDFVQHRFKGITKKLVILNALDCGVSVVTFKKNNTVIKTLALTLLFYKYHDSRAHLWHGLEGRRKVGQSWKFSKTVPHLH